IRAGVARSVSTLDAEYATPRRKPDAISCAIKSNVANVSLRCVTGPTVVGLMLVMAITQLLVELILETARDDVTATGNNVETTSLRHCPPPIAALGPRLPLRAARFYVPGFAGDRRVPNVDCSADRLRVVLFPRSSKQRVVPEPRATRRAAATAHPASPNRFVLSKSHPR